MNNYTFIKKLPDANDYNKLRENVGWGEMPVEIVKQSLKKTLFGISVYDNKNIIGSGRIVGDDGLCFYIQDVMVMKDYQMQKIGTRIMELLMEYIDKNSVYNTYLGLQSAKGLEKFYSKFGFIERPNDVFGSGMTQFWGKPGEMKES